MRRLIAIATFAAIALLVWVFQPDPLPVETAEITRGDLILRTEAEGEARIREVRVVSAPIAGLLQRVDLHPGDDVAAGQTVARIGPVAPALLDARARAVAEASLAAATAAVDLARSQLTQAEATLDFARTEATRARALQERGALSQRLLDDAVLAERTAEAGAASARANLTVRETEVASAQAVLDGGKIGAPSCCVAVTAQAPGRILRVVSEDEQVIPAGTPILELGDPADLEIVVHVLSRDAVGLAVGSPATIIGWGGADLAARVARIEPSATTRVSALGIEEQRVEVRLALSEPPPATLGHGFRVIAQITAGESRDVLRVPVAALFRQGGDWTVFVAADGRAVLRRLTLGARNEDAAEVLTGLTEGERIILHPSDAVTDGARIAP